MRGNKHAEGQRPNSGAFKKGMEPWNKGTKGLIQPNAGSFQKGHTETEEYPVGTITIRADKNGKDRRFIKTKAGWLMYANWLWAREYGALHTGDVVHHLDGNSMNDTPGNLIAVPRAIHPGLHSRWGLRPPTKEVLRWLRSRYASP
jgi:hypothetical protein